MVRGKLDLKRGPLGLTLVLSTAILINAAAAGAQQGPAQPPTEWGGQHCPQQRPTLAVIKNQKTWEEVFAWAFNGSKAPQVDFRTHVVAAVFMGLKMTGGYRVEFKEPYVQEGKLIIPFKEHVPEGIVTQALTTPCRFKAIPVRAGQEVILNNLIDVSNLVYRPIIYRPPVYLGVNRFKCEIPRGWYGEYDKFWYFPQGEIGGLMIMAPAELEGEGVKIFIDHYAPKDNGPLPNPESYVENYPPDDVRLNYIQERFKADAQPPVRGFAGRWFERESTITIRETGKKMKVREQLAVVPAPNGFYALHFWAPGELFDKYAPVFQHVVKSFQPVP